LGALIALLISLFIVGDTIKLLPVSGQVKDIPFPQREIRMLAD